ncbi:hypothetical protein SPRG_02919 [Saprolegnia parasitica CBS 223.65]|uniref:F-box domain-containing protein n=1 Tax=Saprolegnia parasitica (strain CBS 223.65) TaxID=695850 RepID=A0A067D064_SAPPC|nr:hypothetical protein SPRG_02919 [Saprolegnia parasitica CBS 223.65]KDO32442.1 hypothetical protein SPRG_02919 [Saprolegnia parasitica CBS 223.65]|eukprot:XP_012196893.1 hypothetical protein SPRG_02919 [Saprolegnia parasitica CBS 223.65]
MSNSTQPVSAPSAVLQPGIVEAISQYIPRSSDVLNFLDAVPPALMTPTTVATAAFWRNPPVGMTLAWPVLRCGNGASTNPLAVLQGLRALLERGLRVELHHRATRRHHLALFHALYARNVTLVTLQLARDREFELGDRETLVDLVLSLSALMSLVVHVPNADGTSTMMLHELHRLVASTRAASLTLTIEPNAIAPLPFAPALATWLRQEKNNDPGCYHRLALDAPLLHARSTAHEVSAVHELLDALGASSLQELDVHQRCGLGTLPHLVLPRSLRRLRWHVATNDAAALNAFARALEDLEFLESLDTNGLDALQEDPRLQR